MGKLENVLLAIDAYNRKDPQGKEFLYSDKMTQWVLKLNPNPSEALRIAARGQHIGRWTIPRQSYPEGRIAYLQWREELKKFHAKTVGELMAKAGYLEPDIEAVQHIILKKNFRANPDAQTIEDALCLIFLESQFEELRQKTPDAKMIDIIQKTWRKMSKQGQYLALAMDLPSQHKELIQKALKEDA